MSYNADLQAKNARIQALIDKANALPEASEGVTLPTLSNPGSAETMLAGYQLINENNEIVEGAIETKTANDVYRITSSPIICVPKGYYAEEAQYTVDDAEIRLSMSVSDDGVVTAENTSTTSSGFVGSAHSGYDFKATLQLPTQAATTITPGTVDQSIDAGKYLTGAQIIKGDVNLVPENILSGISIFGKDGIAKVIPAGLASVDSGSITPASDIILGEGYTINHNLGEIPDFVLVNCKTSFTSNNYQSHTYAICILNQSFKAYANTSATSHTQYRGDMMYTRTQTNRIVYTNGSHLSAITPYLASDSFTLTSALMNLYTGYTYKWICGKFA